MKSHLYNPNDSLLDVIRALIHTKKEEVFYDFKKEYSDSTSDLIHDIICLSNADHDGDRYIIVGIEDKTSKIVGITEEKLKEQHDLIDTLRAAGFAGGCFPDVTLQKVQIESKVVQVIIIKDTPKKRPFYIVHPTSKAELSPGAIYTRNGDTNTPKNKTANISDTERMWRERFSIDSKSTPINRFSEYLFFNREG